MRKSGSDERRFAKRRLLQCGIWSVRDKQVLRALLSENDHCTIEEAKLAVQTFTNRRVK